MTSQSKTTIKSYFQTGDRPTQSQYSDLIDSYQDANSTLLVLASANVGATGLAMLAANTPTSARSVVSAYSENGGTINGAMRVTGIVSADANAFFNANISVSGTATLGSTVNVSGVANFTQGINVTGIVSAASFVPTSQTPPVNGLFLAAANQIGFSTSSGEKARIDNNGFIFVGCSAAPDTTHTGFRISPSPNSGATISGGGSTTTSQTHIIFINGNGTVGSIATNGSGTAFNTSSDSRLKENVQNLSIGDLFDFINPVTFTWKNNGQSDIGFIAQSLFSQIPSAVTTGDNDMSKLPGQDGFQQWMIDMSKLAPFLVAEIKSLRQRVKTLGG